MIFYGAIDAAAAAGGDVLVGVIFVLGFATALIFALSLHEMSHALAAKMNGDLTAAMYGRLSLNPMRHFDPVGLVMMLLVGFGWARPEELQKLQKGHAGRCACGSYNKSHSSLCMQLCPRFARRLDFLIQRVCRSGLSEIFFIIFIGVQRFVEHKFRAVQHFAAVSFGRVQGNRSVFQKG